jgi:CRISPR-associated exonuclease Cas4
MMQYYHVCKRELWFLSRHVEIDRENPAVVRGTHVDQTSYEGEKRHRRLGMIAVDLLQDGRVVEVKPSSALARPAKMQLLYYLWYLRRVIGIERTGVLAHPRERSREVVELNPENAQEIEDSIRGIHSVVTATSPPPAEEKPFCGSCAYHDFCWC